AGPGSATGRSTRSRSSTPRPTRSSRPRPRERPAGPARDVNPALAGSADLAVAGAVLAVSTRDPRATVLGLLVVLLAAPLIADPWPGALALPARITARVRGAR